MLLRITVLLAVAVLLGGCWSSQTRSVREASGERGGIPFLERETIRQETDSGPDVGALLQAATAALRKDIGGVADALRPKLDLVEPALANLTKQTEGASSRLGQAEQMLEGIRNGVAAASAESRSRSPLTGNSFADSGLATAIAYLLSKGGLSAVLGRRRSPPSEPQTPEPRGERPRSGRRSDSDD